MWKLRIYPNKLQKNLENSKSDRIFIGNIVVTIVVSNSFIQMLILKLSQSTNLKSRVIKLLKIFESEMGILITPYKISLMKLELAFTFATDSIIHLQTRNFIHQVFF